MTGDKNIFMGIRKRCFMANLFKHRKGLSLIEIVVVVAILGMTAVILAPGIANSIEKRGLESNSKEILVTLQQAKYMAVKTRMNCRVRFDFVDNKWEYYIEREEGPDTWNIPTGQIKKYISNKFNANINLPPADLSVVFSPMGFVLNFSSTENTIILQSDKLADLAQPDQRIVSVYAGGAIEYQKNQSE